MNCGVIIARRLGRQLSTWPGTSSADPKRISSRPWGNTGSVCASRSLPTIAASNPPMAISAGPFPVGRATPERHSSAELSRLKNYLMSDSWIDHIVLRIASKPCCNHKLGKVPAKRQGTRPKILLARNLFPGRLWSGEGIDTRNLQGK